MLNIKGLIMGIREWIMLTSAIIIVIGWFFNSHLNRRHEIFKKRLDYRLKMLESYVLVGAALEKLFNPKLTDEKEKLTKEFIEKLENAQVQILLYGTKEEIKMIQEITEHSQKNEHRELKEKSGVFMNLIRKNLRNELGLNEI